MILDAAPALVCRSTQHRRVGVVVADVRVGIESSLLHSTESHRLMPGCGDRVDARAPEPLALGCAPGWTTTKPHDDKLDGARQVVDPPPGPARPALSRSAA